jgi:hypothetical protein
MAGQIRQRRNGNLSGPKQCCGARWDTGITRRRRARRWCRKSNLEQTSKRSPTFFANNPPPAADTKGEWTLKYQIHTHGFPVRDRLIEVGAIVDDISGVDDNSKLVKAQRAVAPPNATPLNGPTYDALKKMYGAHQVRPVPGAR